MVAPATMPKSVLKKTGRQRVIEMVTGIRPGTAGARNLRPRPSRLRDFLDEPTPGDLEAQAEGVGGAASKLVQLLRQQEVNRGATGERLVGNTVRIRVPSRRSSGRPAQEVRAVFPNRDITDLEDRVGAEGGQLSARDHGPIQQPQVSAAKPL